MSSYLWVCKLYRKKTDPKPPWCDTRVPSTSSIFSHMEHWFHLNSGWKRTKTSGAEWSERCCSIKHQSTEGSVFTHPLKNGQNTWEVLQNPGRVFLFPPSSLCCDPFLSELLCHSYQISGVWVAKAARRNKETSSQHPHHLKFLWSLSLLGFWSADILRGAAPVPS